MKKRAKIITTIASLCLAVALMAFGVYAATQVSFNVASKVSFTVRDVFVDIAGKIELQDNVGGTFNLSYDSDYTRTEEDGWAQVGVQVNSLDNGTGNYWDGTGNFDDSTWSTEAAAATYTATSYEGTLGSTATPLATLDDAAWYAGVAKLDSTVNAVRYTITITNRSTTNKIYVSADKLATDFAGANGEETMTYAISAATASGTAGTMVNSSGAKFLPGTGTGTPTAGAYVEVGAEGVLTLVYVYTFTNFTSAIAATAFLDDIAFTIVDENAGTAPAEANIARYVTA